MVHNATLSFDNSYARLPERFYAKLSPKSVQKPELIIVNDDLAGLLAIDPDYLRSSEGLAMLSGNALPGGAEPLAAAYAGHQFGHFVPQLGDGRAVLLGEVVGSDGVRRDLQLKGAGRTPFSRMGDGRAALGPVLREYIVSEAMHKLGVATTRSLAVVTTGEEVYRETPLPGAILARVAQSHVRVGTFQYFAARQDIEALSLLSDYVIERHYPEAREADNPIVALLEGVMVRQATLIAQWLGVGFIHGVMNTDNMSIAGETIDYGPCAFLDEYHPEKVFSSVDQLGRYAFGNQPSIGLWNLTRFAECLLPLISDHQTKAIAAAQTVLDQYSSVFQSTYLSVFSRKLGFMDVTYVDYDLVKVILSIIQEMEGDFTLSFSYLTEVCRTGNWSLAHAGSQICQHAGFPDWYERWMFRIDEEGKASRETRTKVMMRANPGRIARNHLIEKVISKAIEEQDFSDFHEFMKVLSSPFDRGEGDPYYDAAPGMNERVTCTFCGT